MSNTQYILIGADQSMFTQKVRAYLRNNAIPFQDIASDVKIFKTVVLPNAPYPLIPNLMVVSQDTKKFQVIQDSKVIMDYIQKMHGLPESVGAKRQFADTLFEMVLDDFFFLHILNWRWGRPSQQKYLEYTFGDSSQPFEVACNTGARVLNLVGGRTSTLGLTEKTMPVFNEQLSVFLDMLTQHLETYQFLLGNELTRADYSLYGHLAAGLLRDPAPYEWLTSTYPVVHAYVQRVAGLSVQWGSKDVVQVEIKGDTLVSCNTTMGINRGGADVEKTDTVPEGSTKLTALVMRDYITVLGPSVQATIEFLKRQEGKGEVVVPRGLKPEFTFEFTLHGKDGKAVKEMRAVTTHCVYMLQRLLDTTYRPQVRAEVDRWMGEVGCLKEWKDVVATWEGSGWRMDLTRQGTVATKKVDSSRL
ncbi:hypothetical protein H072_1202 [Dactylellina haptotyla CBS 200.50]|uniref:GST N-terminal domain-containing protein n=1 Tax=Dactylellina haptotyla (strain CBS 200.50) TaxID=1284197 RepID=S8BZ64_DACHA|nr:hypothetical protein H072_1202 [Dactylellina haptotyla CBS 200.50]